MKTHGWRAVGVSVVVAVLSGACLPTPSAPPGPEVRAASIALNHVPSARSVLAIREGRVDEFLDSNSLPADRRDRIVWAVVVDGGMVGECVKLPSGQSCPQLGSTTLVVIDPQSEKIIWAESPANMKGFD